MVTSPAHSKIFILDFGSQYTQVIARRVRELQVYSEIVRFDLAAAEIAKLKANGIILSGGPASVYDKGAPQVDPQIFSLGIPVLGICYGMQLMAHHLGGQVEFSARREYGPGILHVTNGSLLFDGIGDQLDIWNSHGDKVIALPAGFRVAARTENSKFAAIEDPKRELYARAAKRFCKTLSITSVTARWIGRWARSSRRLARAFASRSAIKRSCSA